MTNHENIIKAPKSTETVVKKTEIDIAIQVLTDAVRNMIEEKLKDVRMIDDSGIVTVVIVAATETNMIEMIVTKKIIIAVAMIHLAMEKIQIIIIHHRCRMYRIQQMHYEKPKL